MPVLKLFTLYDEKTPLPVPDDKSGVRKLAAASIYMHLSRKMAAQNGDVKEMVKNQFHFAIPVALKGHYEYLQSLTQPEHKVNIAASIKTDFKVAILCNTFSTAQEFFQCVISDLIKAIAGGSKYIFFTCIARWDPNL
jgi:mediator of RNA polymerase II transcription subunit 23